MYLILFYENHKDELNYIILNYILIKSMIYASEVIEKVVSNIEQGKRGDKMFKRTFELINDKLNSILVDKTKYPLELDKKSYELRKLEIRGNKVKFVFLDRDQLTIKVMNFEIDWLSPEPRLKYKNDYLKPYTDKYFR